MARKTGRPAGRPTGVTVKRRPGYLYFVDGQGNVRETPRSTGGKPGRKSCWPRNYNFHGTTIVKTAPSPETVRDMEKKSPRRAQVSEAQYRAMEREAKRRSSVSEDEYRAMERAAAARKRGSISEEDYRRLTRSHRRTTGRK